MCAYVLAGGWDEVVQEDSSYAQAELNQVFIHKKPTYQKL
jgi:hypothetical protein